MWRICCIPWNLKKTKELKLFVKYLFSGSTSLCNRILPALTVHQFMFPDEKKINTHLHKQKMCSNPFLFKFWAGTAETLGIDRCVSGLPLRRRCHLELLSVLTGRRKHSGKIPHGSSLFLFVIYWRVIWSASAWHGEPCKATQQSCGLVRQKVSYLVLLLALGIY